MNEEKKERLSKQAAISQLIDLLEQLNSATECDIGDPLGFFLTDAYDERMKKREQVESIFSGEIGKLAGDDSSLSTADEFRCPLSVDAALRLLNHLIRQRGIECLRKRKSDGARLHSSNDEPNSLITIKGPVLLMGHGGIIGSFGCVGCDTKFASTIPGGTAECP